MSSTGLQYYPQKGRLAKGAIGLAGFLFVFGALLNSPRLSIIVRSIAVLCVIALSAFLLLALSILLSSSPMVVIGDEGLSWNAALSKGALRWDEITGVECLNYRGSWWVKLTVRNEEDFLSRQPIWRRAFLRLLIVMKWPVTATCVPGSGMEGTSAGQIAEHVRRRIKALNRTSN